MAKVKNKENNNYKWVVQVITLSFFISLIMSFIANEVVANVNLIGSLIVLIIIILIGVIFDMIGVSITVAEASMFHSLASKKVKESKVALKLINNAEKASNFCNDVVGDICGVLSGATSATVSLAVSSMLNVNVMSTTFIITAFVSSLTIGLKALGKTTAIEQSEKIVLTISKVISKIW